jgi:chromosome partitioning protein
MTVIAFANSKGGVGKSTLCSLIGSELADQGSSVVILDADGQQSCSQWAERCRSAGTLPASLSVEPIATMEQLTARLQELADADIVLIDVQGSMNDLLTAAVVASDLTIVPTKATVMEMVEAVKLFEWARNLRRAPLRLVLNRVEGIDRTTTAFLDAITLIRTNRLACLNTLVQSRKVYEQFSKDAGTMGLIGTDPAKQEQVRKARKNMADLIEDIIQAINELNPELEKSA